MTSEEAPLTVEKEGPLWILTIRRPHAGNTLDARSCLALSAAFDAFAKDEKARVAVLTGEGEIFSHGEDPFLSLGHGRNELPSTGFGGLTSRFDLWKPVIAAVNGDAFDAGFELVLACDLVVAAETASFGLHQPLNGRIAGYGGVHRLMRALPAQKALGALLTGRRISAPEGVLLGFVNEITHAAGVLASAKQLGRQIVRCSPASIRATKQLAEQGLEHATLREALAAEYTEVESLMAGGDEAEARAAYSEQRPPAWVSD